jgi:cytochrome c7-like protein
VTRGWSALAFAVAGLPALASAGFDHRAHFKKSAAAKCASCHPPTADADKNRPASHDHKACDGEECHAGEFYGPKAQKTDLCLTCHDSRQFWSAQKVRPFPSESDLDRRDWYAEFSHKQHLKKGGPVAEKTDEGCMHCHKDVSASTRKAERVEHESCAQCHTEALAKAPMSRCEACHKYRRDPKGRPLPTGPELTDRPERVTAAFDHYKHRLDRRKAEPTRVSCDTCHPAAAEAETLGTIVPLRGQKTMVEACGTCHRPNQKTADGRRVFTVTGSCNNCHSAAFMHTMSAAPPSHRG